MKVKAMRVGTEGIWVKVRILDRELFLHVANFRFFRKLPSRRERNRRKYQWRKARRRAIRNAGGRCELCGIPLDKGNASVHHILYKSLHPELEFEEWNLMALCGDCHRRIHEN